MSDLQQFRCEPLSCWLTTAQCGERHVQARGGQRGRAGTSKKSPTVCASCPLGEAHARGDEPTRWPDDTAAAGELVELRTLPLAIGEPGSTRLITGGGHDDARGKAPKSGGAPKAAAVSPTDSRPGETPGGPGDGDGQRRGAAAHGSESAPDRLARRGDRASTTTTATEDRRMARRKLHEHDGEEKTISQWARDPRCHPTVSVHALKARVNQGGWPLADALSTPKGHPRPGGKRRRKRGRVEEREPNTAPPAKVTPRGVVFAQARELHPAAAHVPLGTFDAALRAEIESLEAQAAALKLSANLRARHRGEQQPYPSVEVSS